MKYDYLSYLDEDEKDIKKLAKEKRKLKLGDLGQRWNNLLTEWDGYNAECAQLIPPIEQIKPLVEELVKEEFIEQRRHIMTGHGVRANRVPNILGYGRSGLVIQKTYDDWPSDRIFPLQLQCKLGKDLNREYDMLANIKNSMKSGRPKHFPLLREDKCIWYKDRVVALVMETKFGNTADNYAGVGSSLGNRTVIHLGERIFSAFEEMRNAGIAYHRDINPGNLLITDGYETIWDDVVLLDLEYAATTSKSYPYRSEGNRRFNSLNDIISAGQVLYYITTGHSIFASSKKHERFLSDIADEIKYNRDKAYEKEGAIDRKYLHKVDSTIKEKKLAYLIKLCLTAKHTDYKRVHEQFIKAEEAKA